jgi:hypothetical protein
MDYGDMLGEAFEYAKEAFWEKWTRWILLIISTIIFPLIVGYTMEVYRGKKPAPEPSDWVRLFIDGIKLIVAGIIYMIPVLVVIVIFGGAAFLGAMKNAPSPDFYLSHPANALPFVGLFLVGLLIAVILAIIIGLFACLGMVRLARTDTFMEAFNFGAILECIRRIGWGSYILALIIIWIVTAIPVLIIDIFQQIPIIGWFIRVILLLVFIPPIAVFEARYIATLYNQGQAPPVPATPVSPAGNQ